MRQAAPHQWPYLGTCRAALIVACASAAAMSTFGSWAADNELVFGSVESASLEAPANTDLASRDDSIEAWIHPKVASDLKEKLQVAVQIAAARIEGVEECGELFTRLGADGRATLEKALYFPVSPSNRRDGFCRKAVVYTYVGGRSTFVCPEFSRLPDERAAMFVVHEALHNAGLTEKPRDPRGMTSLQINSMIGTNCRF